MNIICSGAGPAGLYFSLLIKKAFPEWKVSLHEKSDLSQATGWGIVLSQGLLAKMSLCDEISYSRINKHMIHWDNICIRTPYLNYLSEDYTFLSLGRQKLISILHARCEELGVDVNYNSKFSIETMNKDACDLLVISEGLNSVNRSIFNNQIGMNEKVGSNKYIWLGLEGDLGECFNFLFVETYAGYLWAHNYKFEDGLSTFVVEMKEETWSALGFGQLDAVESMQYCQNLFEGYLKGKKLLLGDHRHKATFWLNYSEINCDTWSIDQTVLLGNSAHNTHFSIGSGTRLAIEDAMVLVDNITNTQGLNPDALKQYELKRKMDTYDLHSYSRNSMEWFECLPENLIKNNPELFAKKLLNRAGKAKEVELS